MTAATISPRANAATPTSDAPPEGAHTSRQASGLPKPINAAPGGTKSPGDRNWREAQHQPVAGPDHRSGHIGPDAQTSYVAAVQAGQDRPARERTDTIVHPLFDPALALAADVLDDLERVRTANANRLRQLTRSVEDSDGETRGFGLDESHPDVARLAAMVATLEKVEHDATLNLQRVMRKHPLGPWVKATVGVGEKQAARLLAAIGDPYWNTARDCPRTVSALWAYCGYHVLPAGHGRTDTHARNAGGAQLPADQTTFATHGTGVGRTNLPASGQLCLDAQSAHAAGGEPDRGDPDHPRGDAHTSLVGVAPKRQRGQRANWSTAAKMRCFLIAESCIKQARSPYRSVYDDGRAKYTDALHAVACPQCGPKGKPAEPGSPLSAGHQHARAMRLVSKALLRDLWREAKRIHEGAPL